MRSIRSVLFITLLAGALAACGSDSDDSATESDDELREQTTGTSGECAETDLTFTNSDTGDTIELDYTAATSLGDGAAYTAYAADFEIDPENLRDFETPDIPAGGNLVTVFVTVFNSTEDIPPVETGAVIGVEGGANEHVLGVVHETADSDYGISTGSEGSITITGVGDTFCGDLEYTDNQKSLIGTIAAPVEAEF